MILLMTRLLMVLLLAVAALPAQSWQSMFDGKTLANWTKTEFQRAPSPRVENGLVILPAGQPLTGITWTGSEFPKTGYEIRFEAQRQLGGDFFASVTFPSGPNFATWVLGGWGGDIVGISSIDGWDASDNETRSYFNFESNRWYAFRLQVTEDRIQGWIDGQRVVNVEIRGRAISLRIGETKLSAPLGFASYNTTGAIRKIEYRKL
jgi:hypothetical protein